MRANPIYLFCLVVFPVLIVAFFTSIMSEGQPEEMPVGVVDHDNSAVTRQLISRLDAFQSTRVVGQYASVSEARRAMQHSDIYAFIYFPERTSELLLAGRQPTVSFYYTNTSVTTGALLYRDLKTITTLATAATASAKLSALGKTEREIMAFLQPISVDLHPLHNPEMSYNVYLSTSLIPACLTLFIVLMAAYSIGTELKFNRSKEWLSVAGNNIVVALAGKLLPQLLVFLAVFSGYFFYIFHVLHFPAEGSWYMVVLLQVLTVMACQGLGTFLFGLLPSLRMSMSVCSLWSALSFSIMGATFPLSAMDGEIIALAQLFPMRHYFMAYQISVFNGFHWTYAFPYLGALAIFAALPLTVLFRIKKAMLEYVYIP